MRYGSLKNLQPFIKKIPIFIFSLIFLGMSQETWTMRNPAVKAEAALNSVVWGNGVYVTVGEAGTIKTSIDGTNWISRASGAMVTLRDVTFGDGIFAAVGDSGTILISTDGIAWEQKSGGTDIGLSSVAIGNNLLVTMSGVYSIAGEWKKIVDSVGGDGFVSGNGRFIKTSGVNVYTSNDGKRWDSVYSAGPMCSIKVSATTKGFVGIVRAYSPASPYWRYYYCYSSDGFTWVNWSLLEISSVPRSVTFGNNSFVGIGENGYIHTSPDGASGWTRQISGTTQSLNDIAWHNGQYVAVGVKGIILNSPDGIKWTNVNGVMPTAYYADLYSIAASATSWVANGAAMLQSFTLSDWQCVADTIARPPGGICWGNDRFVAASSYITLVSHSGSACFYRFATSKDGINWIFRSYNSNQYYFIPKALAWADTQCIAVGESGIATSSDGINWRLPSTSGLKLNDIAIGLFNGVSHTAVAVGDSGVIGISSDGGVNWISCVSGTTARLNTICYGDSGYVAIKEGYALLLSRDGESWKDGQTILGHYLNDIAWGAGAYVAVGNAGAIVTSPDALRWTLRSSGTTQNLKSVIWSSGYFVAVGDSGTILSSPAPVPVRHPAQTRESGSYLTLNGSLVTYASGTPGPVRLALYNMQGRCVEVLNSKCLSNGVHCAVLPNTLRNGTYILSLRAGKENIIKKFNFSGSYH
jgi:hypothetical protein